MKTFKEVEIKELFKYNHLFWVKNSPETATSVSDDLYNDSKNKWFPSGGKDVSFAKHLQVKEVDSLNRVNHDSAKILGALGFALEPITDFDFKIVSYPLDYA